MALPQTYPYLVFIGMMLGVISASRGEKPLVIAHRGASGYLPEHTLAAKAMAFAQGADYLEQDVVLTRDDHPIVIHDIHLAAVTNVAEVFPQRSREDGRYYAIDFSLAEIKSLRVNERIRLSSGKTVYPHRFPQGKSAFQVPTLAEEIELIQGLNSSSGRHVGIYLEPKAPAWHRQQGKDLCKIVLDVLGQYGYRKKTDRAIVQSFDASETRRMRDQLQTQLRLVQLIGENDWDETSTDFELLRTPAGLKRVAQYADGIGPWLSHVVQGDSQDGRAVITPLVEWAHQEGLFVHPYTFRADALPSYVESYEELLEIFVHRAQVDGLFTDFPDRVVDFLSN